MKKWKTFKADYGDDSKEATPIVAFYDASGLTPKQMQSTLKHGPSVPSLFKLVFNENIVNTMLVYVLTNMKIDV